jgi:hypothetical protein
MLHLYQFEIRFFNSVRIEFLALIIESTRTVFLLHPLPRAAFRFVPPSTLPWADRQPADWPFRPKQHKYSELRFLQRVASGRNENCLLVEMG